MSKDKFPLFKTTFLNTQRYIYIKLHIATCSYNITRKSGLKFGLSRSIFFFFFSTTRVQRIRIQIRIKKPPIWNCQKSTQRFPPQTNPNLQRYYCSPDDKKKKQGSSCLKVSVSVPVPRPTGNAYVYRTYILLIAYLHIIGTV